MSLWLLLFSCASVAAQSSSADQPKTTSSPEIVPFLSWQDIKALYPPKRYPADWNSPKFNDIPHKQELIERCERDLELSLKASPDPFYMNRPASASISGAQVSMKKDSSLQTTPVKESQESLNRGHSPWQLNHPFPPGKLHLISTNKEPDSRLVYFVFSYESDLINDLFVVYYYDPQQNRFILKSTR